MITLSFTNTDPITLTEMLSTARRIMLTNNVNDVTVSRYTPETGELYTFYLSMDTHGNITELIDFYPKA